jgi:crotonobetainyl-CoA:carnitine CoA-transferase CaiB-like acyl-CoA transferase
VYKANDHSAARRTEIFADYDACVFPVLSAWQGHEHPHNKASACAIARSTPDKAPAVISVSPRIVAMLRKTVTYDYKWKWFILC